MLDDLFPFPIVMVDGDEEEKKKRKSEDMALEEDIEMDIVIGEAEVPFYDFVSVTDRWIPNRQSLERAMTGKFNACFVVFANSGGFLVPWTKKRFKNELKNFSEQREKDSPKVQAIELSPENQKKIISILGLKKDEEDEDTDK